ncbi:hypothetical protein G4V62_15070 [Bacillaceae bacterium SIJ1]|nr:hypothetical protein [Litoribacterium kuwaitense]NGP46208.1 hypothetical protein [Litoribacterium kuwaitense]
MREDKKKDAAYLREDLAKLGAVIRDERHGQYVRMAQWNQEVILEVKNDR